MENTSAKPQKSENKSSKRGLFIIVVVLLLAANGFLLWKFFAQSNENRMLSEGKIAAEKMRDSVSTELDKFKGQYADLQKQNSGLQGELAAKNEEIQQKIAQIDKLKRSGDAAQLAAARRQLTELREMIKGYETQINELKAANAQLTQQNSALNTDLTSTRQKVDTLNQQNTVLSNKVAIGSVLKADKIAISSVKFKSSGKELPTTKAKSVQKIKACFTIMENRVVDPGMLDVFLRILGPDGSALTTSTETFDYNGQPTVYTVKQQVNYENKNSDLCVYWAKGSEFAKGNYTVEIYSGGNLIGIGKTVLK
jgi:cell division protein FtsB